MTAGHREYSAASLEDLADLRAFVERTAKYMGASEGEVGELVMAANEAVENVIVHGYLLEPGSVKVIIESKDGVIILRIFDRSPGFDPSTVKAPDVSLPPHLRPLGGLGVQMIRSFTDEINYFTSPSGENELVLVKKLSN